MRWRIGDRFRYSFGKGWFIWEIVDYTQVNNYFEAIVVMHSDGGGVGQKLGQYTIDKNDEYIGNFAKSENFTALYEKLSSTN